MFIRDSRRSYRTYSYAELILITDLGAFRTPVGVTELMLMLQSLNLFGGTHRYHRDYGTYTGFTELNLIREYPQVLLDQMSALIPTCVGIILITDVHSFETPVEVTELILIQNLYLFLYFGYGSTRSYYKTFYLYYRVYFGISNLLLVLRSIYMYFRFYTCTTEFIHVFQILHVYYGTYTGLTELIFVYMTYSYLTDLILVLQN